MKFLSHLAKLRVDDVVHYDSEKRISSTLYPGVNFVIHRMSFGRRLSLCHRIREIAPKLEFLESGTEFAEKVEANLLGQEIENLYLRWGLSSLQGMLIDGETVTADLLITGGPEALAKEIVTAIKAECGLTEEERKN